VFGLPRSLEEQEENMIEATLKDTRGCISGLTAAAVKSTAGDRVRFVGMSLGITQRQAEEGIRRQEAELRQMMDLTPLYLGLLGPDGRRLYANHTALDYFGMTLEKWRAQNAHIEFAHPEDRDYFLAVRNKRFLEGKSYEFEARLLRHDGEFRCFLFRMNPIRDEQGQIARWYATATDIEDRKQAEEEIRKENIVLREEIDKTSMFEEIVGASAALQSVLADVSKVAPTDSTVLITGETGTGKELLARAIHKRSRRSARTFVSVNCAAIPSSLLASELFGHEKGAFTGATQRRQGRFELAEGGTIFLDEIGELPAETQIALLRVLQEREFDRVGGGRPIPTNVRVIAATNSDLQSAIEDTTFRSDLFYRLNVFPLEMPALRDRREDIPLLIQYFTHRLAKRAGKKINKIRKETLNLLQSYDWPGNVRELQNVVERAIIVSESDSLDIDERWFPVPTRHGLTAVPPRPALVAREKDSIEDALIASKGRVSGPFGAAARLGLPSSTLESKIKSLDIDKRRFQTASHR
jgi:PAS domain S-box-containing protein